jgi:hypothetical protein
MHQTSNSSEGAVHEEARTYHWWPCCRQCDRARRHRHLQGEWRDLGRRGVSRHAVLRPRTAPSHDQTRQDGLGQRRGTSAPENGTEVAYALQYSHFGGRFHIEQKLYRSIQFVLWCVSATAYSCLIPT